MSISMMLRSMAVLYVVLSGVAVGVDKQGLVAHWTFDEGKGRVARDATGNGNDGKIFGARFAKYEKGYILRFDGLDDYVWCRANPSLNIEKAGTVTVWFNPGAHQGGIFTRSTGGRWYDQRCVVTYRTYGLDKSIVFCMSSGLKYDVGSVEVPRLNTWSHLALTISGPTAKLYRNGILLGTRKLSFNPRFGDIPLILGRSQGLGKRYFRGLMDDVRVYNRALSHTEIITQCKAEAELRGADISELMKPKLSITSYPASGRMLVGVNYQLMKPIPAGMAFSVFVRRPGERRALARARIAAPAERNQTEVIFDLQGAPAGELEVTAYALQPPEKGKKPLFGKAGRQMVKWPEPDARFSAKKGVRILNNFVFELLNEKSPGAKEFTIHNPREGWIVIAVPTTGLGTRAPTVLVDSEEVPLRQVGDAYESMRYLSEGPHKIKMGGDVKAQRIIARAIPELFYNMYGANPLVPKTGDYTWAWLRKHVLDHYNCVIGLRDFEKQENEIKEWTSEGKRWFTQRGLPWVKTADEAYDYWSKEPGMTHPLMHGIWADEFSFVEKYQKMYPIWGEALRRIKADPKFKGRRFYAYMGMTYKSGYDQLTKTIMECAFRLAPEWYLREQPSEEKAMDYMSPSWERASRERIDKAYPGAGMNRVVVLALLSQPEESCDIRPDVNFNVYLDLELHFMANDPAFFGTRGLQGYYSPYAGEEQTRVFARLVRHYAIEGHTERLFKDPYKLTHLENPDFVEGTKGWALSAAAEGNMTAKKAEKFGWLEGRFDTSGVGDTVLWTKRSAKKPNVFAQEIKNLEPGRLYSLRFFTGNFQDYLKGKSRGYKHGTSVKVENADLIPDKTFQTNIKSCYAHTYKSFNQDNNYRMNYYQRVFRAKGKTARLVLSDWTSDTKPGGAEGTELIWNFMQVQPYFAED